MQVCRVIHNILINRVIRDRVIVVNILINRIRFIRVGVTLRINIVNDCYY